MGAAGGEEEAQQQQQQQKMKEAQVGERSLKVAELALRLKAFALCAAVVALLKQNIQTVVIAPGVQLQAKYDNTKAPQALLVLASICLAYSAMLAALCVFRLCRLPFVAALERSKAVAWIFFLADQVLTYALLGATAATAEAAYIAKNGESKVQWRAVCGPFERFCHRFAATVFVAFLAVAALATSAAISAFLLFRRYASAGAAAAAASSPPY